MQGLMMHQASSFRVRAPFTSAGPVKSARSTTVILAADGERYRLNNLSPWEGSRRQEKRKGRGYGAGQGGTCGFGMRGQKARSGSGTRPGFEGGQTPLYRRLPKLRGICGGMPAGVNKFVAVNLATLAENFQSGEEVSLEILKEKGVLNTSGKEDKLPLKILGNGELSFPLTIKAASLSESAKQKIEAAGGSVEVVALKPKWTRAAHNEMVAKLTEAGQDYKALKAQKKADRAAARGKKVEVERQDTVADALTA